MSEFLDKIQNLTLGGCEQCFKIEIVESTLLGDFCLACLPAVREVRVIKCAVCNRSFGSAMAKEHFEKCQLPKKGTRSRVVANG